MSSGTSSAVTAPAATFSAGVTRLNVRIGKNGHQGASGRAASIRHTPSTAGTATPPPPEGDPRPWPANFTHRRVRMSRAEAKTLHARISALLEEVETAGQERFERGEEAHGDGLTVYRYDVFWASGAAAEDETGESR